MPRGIWRIHSAVQSQQARADYAAMVERARAAGVAVPEWDATGHGWRVIDKRLAALRVRVEEAEKGKGETK